MYRTRITALAAGVVMVAGLTACGSESADGGGDDKVTSDKKAGGLSPLAALKKASDQTEKQESAKVDGTTDQGTPQGTTSSTMKGELTWAEGGTTGNMDITQRGGMVSGTPTEGKPMKARYTADAMFMNMGDEFASTAGKGKHWIKYDYDKLAETAGASGAFIKDQMQNNNPARSVQLLMATGKVEKVGTETVRGKKATHYSGTVDVSEMARMQSKELSETELQELQDQLEQAGMESEKIDLWIDGDNLLVKKQETAKSSNGSSGSYDSTVYYADYGTEVTVEEPPSADTVGFEELTGPGAGV
ncbi:hypothetical protein LHJ74_20280 [Streptomyces sp. N2-109]|uniref:Lipoprotein n=1 Tax=Streptomyces gossypii TaxID=2883101 RepID=A0ABT2JY01_9ACTN|nr:hypothetical protein [Streptomyces gossypii]MCT2592210.1 hypothetical protein [Streptomyces gossypii]